MSLEARIEALLFITDQPLSTTRLTEVLSDADREDIGKAIKALEKKYEESNCAFHIARIAGGFQLLTREEYGPLVRQLFRGKRRVRLTKAALETLAIIAYKQPTTRPEVDAIRGVSSGGVLETLMERDLVRIAGRAEGIGRPLLYATTATFLQYLGLNNLKDLPSLSELEAMIAEREEADRAEEEREMQELSELAEMSPEEPRPAATLEERLAQEALPSLDEIDSELLAQGAQLEEVSDRLAAQAQDSDDDAESESEKASNRSAAQSATPSEQQAPAESATTDAAPAESSSPDEPQTAVLQAEETEPDEETRTPEPGLS